MEISKKVFAAVVVGSMAMGSAGGAVTHKMTAKPQVVTVEVAPIPKSKPKAATVSKKETKKPVAVKKEMKSTKTNEALPRGV